MPTKLKVFPPFFIICLLLTSFPARYASAGGYEYGTDNGALSVARGGASTALGSNPNAIYVNPAAFADVERRAEVHLSANLAMRQLWFQRMMPQDGDNPPYLADPVEDLTPIAPGVSLSGVVRVTPWMVVGLGIVSPAAVGTASFTHGTLDSPGAGRYDMTDMQFTLLWPTLSLAISIPCVPGLRFGVSFQPGFVNIKQTTYAAIFGPDQPNADVKAELDLWDPFVPGGQFGVLYRLRNMELGFSLRVSGSLETSGTTTATVNPYEENAENNVGQTNAQVRAPWAPVTLRAGIRYFYARPGASEQAPPWEREVFDVEFDFVYENTSYIDRYDVNLGDSVVIDRVEYELPRMSIDHYWKDCFNLRLGASLNLLRGMLSTHMGMFWESESAPNAYTRLDFAPWMRVGLGFGLTVRVSIVEITAAYQHIFMPDREVSLDEGKIRAIAIEGDLSYFEEPAINAGNYSASYDIVSLSLSLRM